MAAAAARPGGKAPPIPPNQTLYVTNLPSAKVQKADLKTALYLLFSTYGIVLDVVALKTMKMRGQAHIVFRDVQAATQAMRALEGFLFLGRELVSCAMPLVCNMDRANAMYRGFNTRNLDPTQSPSSTALTRCPGRLVLPPTSR